MNIFVKSKKEMQDLIDCDSSILDDEDNMFISICGGLDTLDRDDIWPFEKTGDNILKIVFDDISDREYEKLTMFTNKDICKLFDEDDAKTILDFVERNKDKKNLYINCKAGVSRSGAVGEAISYKYQNADERKQFYSDNLQIIPNAYVRSILVRLIDGDKDYSKIFHNFR